MPQSTGLNLLARILEDGRLADFLRLRPENFYQDEPRVFQWIERHVQRHGVLPSLQLAVSRTDLEAVDSNDPYGVWFDQYAQRAVHNRFNDAIPSINRLLMEDQTDEAIARTVALVESTHAVRVDSEQDLMTMQDVGREVLQELIDLRSRGGMSGIPTGWPSLDRVTNGYQRGDLIVFMARPKMGKSTALIHMANAASRAGHVVLFISMEMKRTQIGRRLFAMLAGLDMQTLRAGRLTTVGERMIRTEIERFEQRPAFYLIEGQFKKEVGDLTALVHTLRPEIVFIDGAYLVRMSQGVRSRSTWERMAEVAEGIKTLAYTQNIPVVTSFQISREGGKKGKEASWEHVQLADAISQLASLGAGIFEHDQAGYFAQFRRIVKAFGGREGETVEFEINWNWERMDFSEVPQVRYDDEEDGSSTEPEGD